MMVALSSDLPVQIITKSTTFDALDGLKASVHNDLKEIVCKERGRRLAALKNEGFKFEWAQVEKSMVLSQAERIGDLGGRWKSDLKV